MDTVIDIFEPDGSTPRESYTETLGTKGDEEMVIRDLRFTILANGGSESFSFTIYKDIDTVDTIEGDVISIKGDGGKIRYVGKVDRIIRDYSDTDPEYEDKSHVTGRGTLMRADVINFSLRESDGTTVSTNMQDLLDDLFQGGEYSGKGQANNQPIETAIPLITYTPVNNVLEILNINVSYKDTPAWEIMNDVIRLNNGTLDLTAVEPYLYYLQTDGNFYTEQRVTSLLDTYDIDDGEFPTKASDDITDDGYNIGSDNAGIYNKYILNGEELTTLQYGTEVTSSRSAHGTITAPNIDNKNITVAEGQKWLDGFILDTLEPINTYALRLRKKTYGFSPVWFLGDTETPNGYIKLTEGGTGTLFQEPFLSASYALDSSGWDIVITAGKVRPNVDTRARILTEFTGLGKYDAITIELTEPSDTADEDTLQGVEFLDYGDFRTKWDNQDFTVAAADVVFKVKSVGVFPWSVGGTVKTLTSVSSPGVFEDPNISGLFRVSWFNGTSGTRDISGTTIYPLGLTNETQYNVWAEVTVNVSGVDHILKSSERPFFLTGQTTANKGKDYNSRIPAAEQTNVRSYTPVATELFARMQFFEASDPPPDAGAKGWFITNDDTGAWTRMTGDFAGNIIGTSNDTFEINIDDTSETVVDLIFTANSGANKGAIRFDYNGGSPKIMAAPDYEGTPTWTDLATQASDKITASFSGDVYELKTNSSDGSLTFIKDPGGGGETFLLKITNQGEMKTYDFLEPAVDEQDDIGSPTKKYDNLYLTNDIYVEDVTFTSDGGATTNAKLEWDGVEGLILPENIAFGFMDD